MLSTSLCTWWFAISAILKIISSTVTFVLHTVGIIGVDEICSSACPISKMPWIMESHKGKARWIARRQKFAVHNCLAGKPSIFSSISFDLSRDLLRAFSHSVDIIYSKVCDKLIYPIFDGSIKFMDPIVNFIADKGYVFSRLQKHWSSR